YDGKGYPEGLKGKEIPLSASIISVADSFDAMTTDRPYRKALTREEALLELKRCSGTQFDPDVVKVACKALLQQI
ncbi:MAG TPA: HD-GYP domain-containing protein, partial [Candidatus Omnitrophica bacterium]|nr:HD-GYP domain-containing protein [Candidatus Omnitrophota bacterium]